MLLRLATAEGEPGGEGVLLRSAALRRGLGLRPVWKCRAARSQDGTDRHTRLLTTWSMQGPGVALALELGTEVFPLSFLGAEAPRSEGERGDFVIYLAPGPPVEEALPERRVLTGTDSLALFHALEIEVAGNAAEQGLPGLMQRDQLPYGTVAIADGLTTLEAAVALLQDFRRRQRLRGESGAARSFLGLDLAPGRLRLAWGQPEFVETAEAAACFGPERDWQVLPTCDAEPAGSLEGGALASAGVVARAREDELEPATVAAWLRRPLPLLLQGMIGAGDFLAHRAHDRLTARQGHIYWEPSLTFLPHGVPAPHGPGFLPWLGCGRCLRTITDAKEGFWVEVSLEGFAKGHDTVLSRLNAVYTAQGGQGLHLPPAEHSRVALAWSGRVGEPVLCLGNVRQANPDDATVSLSFPAGQVWKWSFGDHFRLVAEHAKIEGRDGLALKGRGVRATLEDTVKIDPA